MGAKNPLYICFLSECLFYAASQQTYLATMLSCILVYNAVLVQTSCFMLRSVAVEAAFFGHLKLLVVENSCFCLLPIAGHHSLVQLVGS
jgi:hypothetical protein